MRLSEELDYAAAKMLPVTPRWQVMAAALETQLASARRHQSDLATKLQDTRRTAMAWRDRCEEAEAEVATLRDALDYREG